MVIVDDELLRGLAAAAEEATEKGDAEILQGVRTRAYSEMGVVTDLWMGMTYDEALAALRGTLESSQRFIREALLMPLGTPTHAATHRAEIVAV